MEIAVFFLGKCTFNFMAGIFSYSRLKLEIYLVSQFFILNQEGFSQSVFSNFDIYLLSLPWFLGFQLFTSCFLFEFQLVLFYPFLFSKRNCHRFSFYFLFYFILISIGFGFLFLSQKRKCIGNHIFIVRKINKQFLGTIFGN